MTNDFDVLIIGGGIYGASIFFHLTKNPNISVMLVEKNTIASGATAHSKGFIRSYHSSIDHCTLALNSYPFFKSLEHHPECPFIKTGFLTIESKEKINEVQKNVTYLRQKGCTINVFDSRSILPHLTGYLFPLHDNKLYIFEEEAGYAHPKQITHWLIKEGIKQGGRVLEQVEINSWIEKNNKIDHVLTGKKPLNARVYVLSTGASSCEWLSHIEEYQTLDKKMIHIGCFSYDQKDAPLLTFLEKEYGFFGRHSHGDICFLGLTTPTALKDIYTQESDFYLKELERKAQHYLSDASIRFLQNVSHVDVYNTESHGIADFSTQFNNLFVCTGWSGVGFKMSWEMGRLSAEKIIRKLHTQLKE